MHGWSYIPCKSHIFSSQWQTIGCTIVKYPTHQLVYPTRVHDFSWFIPILWVVAKSCTTKRMVESLKRIGCLPPGAGFRNHSIRIHLFYRLFMGFHKPEYWDTGWYLIFMNHNISIYFRYVWIFDDIWSSWTTIFTIYFPNFQWASSWNHPFSHWDFNRSPPGCASRDIARHVRNARQRNGRRRGPEGLRTQIPDAKQ